jgi:hypothetical protein
LRAKKSPNLFGTPRKTTRRFSVAVFRQDRSLKTDLLPVPVPVAMSASSSSSGSAARAAAPLSAASAASFSSTTSAPTPSSFSAAFAQRQERHLAIAGRFNAAAASRVALPLEWAADGGDDEDAGNSIRTENS